MVAGRGLAAYQLGDQLESQRTGKDRKWPRGDDEAGESDPVFTRRAAFEECADGSAPGFLPRNGTVPARKIIVSKAEQAVIGSKWFRVQCGMRIQDNEITVGETRIEPVVIVEVGTTSEAHEWEWNKRAYYWHQSKRGNYQ